MYLSVLRIIIVIFFIVGNVFAENDSFLPTPGTFECGIDTKRRIIGGNVTDVDEHPWLALLEYTHSNGEKKFLCGGVLINNQYVLTAAHCVTRIPKLTSIRLGEWDTSTTNDCDHRKVPVECVQNPVQDIEIDESIQHEEYSRKQGHHHNDIAILKLIRRAVFNDYVKPICLPSFIDERLGSEGQQEKTRYTVAGWGRTSKYSNLMSNHKMKVDILEFNHDRCKEMYLYSSNKTIVSTQICAGGTEEGKDSCKGDSGGPLMSIHYSSTGLRYTYLAGLVSFGQNPCGQPGWPGVYTRVASYIDWIESIIGPTKSINILPKHGDGICGTSYVHKIHRENSEIEIHSWIVFLEYNDDSGQKQFKCVGSLINKRYVVTAAHCIKKQGLRLVGVRYGKWASERIKRCSRSGDIFRCLQSLTYIEIQETNIHENYLPNDGLNDIALLRLQSPIEYTDEIRPVCLPTVDELRNKAINEGDNIISSDWAYVHDPSWNRVIVSGYDKCLRNFQEQLLSDIYDEQICTSSICGHGGEPLMGETNGFKYLIGILTNKRSGNCENQNTIDIYTKIESYTNWIRDTIKP